MRNGKDGLEQSLHRALCSGNAEDPAFRQAVYAAAMRALEQLLGTDPRRDAAADRERARLAGVIAAVEARYAPEGGLPTTVAEPTVEPSPGTADAEPPEESGPPLPLEEGADAAGLPDKTGDIRGADERPDEPATIGVLDGLRRDRLRRMVSVVGFVFIALVILVASLMVLPMLQPDVGGSAQSASAGPEGGQPVGIFTGRELELISTPEGGSVRSVAGEGDASAVRIAGAAGRDGEILVSVGPGVIAPLAGHKARVEIAAGSPDGKPRAFEVRFLLRGKPLGEARHFSVTARRDLFDFELDIPKGAAKAGAFAIDPGPGGADLDLYAIDLRAED